MKKKILAHLEIEPELKACVDKITFTRNGNIAQAKMYAKLIDDLRKEDQKVSSQEWEKIEKILKEKNLIPKDYKSNDKCHIEIESELKLLVLCEHDASDEANEDEGVKLLKKILKGVLNV